MENLTQALKEEMIFAAEKLSARLKFDQNNDFYQCGSCGKTMTFNDAMTLNFVCPECGENMSHFDNELLLKALEKRIDKMNRALED